MSSIFGGVKGESALLLFCLPFARSVRRCQLPLHLVSLLHLRFYVYFIDLEGLRWCWCPHSKGPKRLDNLLLSYYTRIMCRSPRGHFLCFFFLSYFTTMFAEARVEAASAAARPCPLHLAKRSDVSFNDSVCHHLARRSASHCHMRDSRGSWLHRGLDLAAGFHPHSRLTRDYCGVGDNSPANPYLKVSITSSHTTRR